METNRDKKSLESVVVPQKQKICVRWVFDCLQTLFLYTKQGLHEESTIPLYEQDSLCRGGGCLVWLQTEHIKSSHTHATWQDEEYSGHEGEDGALRPDVSNVADDKSGEDEEQGDHGEGSGSSDHFWRTGRIVGEDKRRTEMIKTRSCRE